MLAAFPRVCEILRTCQIFDSSIESYILIISNQIKQKTLNVISKFVDIDAQFFIFTCKKNRFHTERCLRA